jgi:hypothetical protein
MSLYTQKYDRDTIVQKHFVRWGTEWVLLHHQGQTPFVNIYETNSEQIKPE